jgi:predicted phosphodiesterase
MSHLPETVKTRLFIISDTHSHARKPSISLDGPFRPPFPRADILIHTGDLTVTGKIEEHKRAIELLASIPAELKLVIAGNHDLNLDKEYYISEDSPAQSIGGNEYDKETAYVAEELWIGQEAKNANITYLTEGMHEFELENGAKFKVYASEWQPECKLILLISFGG